VKIQIIRHSCERRNPEAAKLNAAQQHFSHTAWIPGQARNDGSPAFSYIGVSKLLIMIVYRENGSEAA
jgi:hypothetical protein